MFQERVLFTVFNLKGSSQLSLKDKLSQIFSEKQNLKLMLIAKPFNLVFDTYLLAKPVWQQAHWYNTAFFCPYSMKSNAKRNLNYFF